MNANPAPLTVQLIKDIRLMSGRVIPAGTRLSNVIPHPRGAFYRRPVYLAKAAFESCGFACDLSVFHDECRVVA